MVDISLSIDYNWSTAWTNRKINGQPDDLDILTNCLSEKDVLGPFQLIFGPNQFITLNNSFKHISNSKKLIFDD